MVHRNSRRTELRVVPLLLFFLQINTPVCILGKSIVRSIATERYIMANEFKKSGHDYMLIGMQAEWKEDHPDELFPDIAVVESLPDNKKLHVFISDSHWKKRDWDLKHTHQIARLIDKEFGDGTEVRYSGKTTYTVNEREYHVLQILYAHAEAVHSGGYVTGQIEKVRI